MDSTGVAAAVEETPSGAASEILSVDVPEVVKSADADAEAERLLQWAQEELARLDAEVVAVESGAGVKRRRGAPIPADAWRQFTPDVINEDLCLARVKNLGKGGQCRRRR